MHQVKLSRWRTGFYCKIQFLDHLAAIFPGPLSNRLVDGLQGVIFDDDIMNAHLPQFLRVGGGKNAFNLPLSEWQPPAGFGAGQTLAQPIFLSPAALVFARKFRSDSKVARAE